MRLAGLVCAVFLACSRAPAGEEPAAPWKPPADPAWDDLPKTDEAALALAAKRTVVHKKMNAFNPNELAFLRADASLFVAGPDAIAAAYDGWMRADASKPSYVIFGTMHDSRVQIDTVASIVFRMKSVWGFALEQFRAEGRWHDAPNAPSADDADLAALTRPGAPFDEGALARLGQRQRTFDHAAWKFDYLDAMTSLVWKARGAGVPLLGCDMPPELRASFTPGSEAERAMRELHCVRALHTDALAAAPAHAPDGGLSEDDPAPPERFAILAGARHAEPDGIARFLDKNARVALVRVLGGRPEDGGGDETDLATKLVVTDVVLVRGHGPDMLLLPGSAWGGTVDRSSDRGDPMPAAPPGLPRPNVMVTCDGPARFSVTDSSVDVGGKAEWLSVRAGHHGFVLVAESRTFVGAVDVPEAGYAELQFSPKDRAVREILHAP